ncbi:MAG: hypothetical protein D6732_13860 [Methanobacteriota archaeon]|nr:MAG: hypothetical protein D6732_13860 [Euryarchaeota archaeon]
MSNKEKEDAFKQFANNLLNIEKEAKEKKAAKLKEGIEELENEKDTAVLKSRTIKTRMSQIREQAGISTFVGTSGEIKSPRFRRGKFLQLLARELLLIGTEELREETGGICSIERLGNHFKETRENWKLREGDIQDAISILVKQKLIPGFVDNEKKIVQFIPKELDSDANKLLIAASGLSETNFSQMQATLGWSEERLKKTLHQLETQGLVIKEGENLFFPGL